MDYGCGCGNFVIDGLLNVDSDALGHIKYTGVDIDEASLEIARFYSEKHGFDSMIKGEPEFIPAKEYCDNQNDSSADFIFCTRTFHDIELVDLPGVIYHNLRILKKGGSLIIYDKGEMPKADELNFVIWEHEDFKTLFNNEKTLECDIWSMRPAEKDRKEIHVVITKRDENIPPQNMFEDRCIEVYKNKVFV